MPVFITPTYYRYKMYGDPVLNCHIKILQCHKLPNLIPAITSTYSGSLLNV